MRATLWSVHIRIYILRAQFKGRKSCHDILRALQLIGCFVGTGEIQIPEGMFGISVFQFVRKVVNQRNGPDGNRSVIRLTAGSH